MNVLCQIMLYRLQSQEVRYHVLCLSCVSVDSLELLHVSYDEPQSPISHHRLSLVVLSVVHLFDVPCVLFHHVLDVSDSSKQLPSQLLISPSHGYPHPAAELSPSCESHGH